LAAGTVKTPEFSVVKNGWHWIMIQVEKPLPFDQMMCMMGTASSRLDLKYCSGNDPLLRADWVAYEDGHIVLSGSSTTTGDQMWDDKYIFKFIGSFPVLLGKKYVVEVKFTKDGTPLNVANPHLIIVRHGEE
jgi:hypothetical protein